MPANNPVADLIMRLMREGNQRGMGIIESPELSQYLNQSYLSKRVQPRNTPPNAQGMGQVINPGTDAFASPSELYRPNPFTEDPWFTENLPPGAGGSQPPITEGPSVVRPGSTAGGDGQIYLWGIKNGQATRLDGPFPDAQSAMVQLQRLQQNIDPRSGFTLTIAPDNGTPPTI